MLPCTLNWMTISINIYKCLHTHSKVSATKVLVRKRKFIALVLVSSVVFFVIEYRLPIEMRKCTESKWLRGERLLSTIFFPSMKWTIVLLDLTFESWMNSYFMVNLAEDSVVYCTKTSLGHPFITVSKLRGNYSIYYMVEKVVHWVIYCVKLP